MRVIDENTITDAALEQMSSTSDPRLRTIMAALVRHLHAFTREVDLTPEEWLEAVRFLTAVGQKCTPHRQEFILLSDTLGLSSLVNALHDKRATDDSFQEFLELIERRADDNRPFVRKAVNWALRQIGKRNLALNRLAIRTGEAIRARQTPAARWISSDALRELRSEPVQKRLRSRQ